MSETNLSLRYDQVSFVATHNSYTGYFFGPPEGFAGSTQDKDIPDQLKMGVRLLQLDIYREGSDGEFYCKHGDYFEKVSLGRCLKDIQKFMTTTDQNAVIGISIEPHINMGDQKTVRDLMGAFKDAGLDTLIFRPDRWTFDIYQQWPTLRQMIQNNWRLVVFSQDSVVRTGDPEIDRILNQYDYFVETVYDEPSISAPEWTCARSESKALWATNRGLFLMSHFKNWDPFGDAAYTNRQEALDQQISTCKALYLRTPNFINVNYFEQGHNGGPKAVAAENSPATRLMAPINLTERLKMTDSIFIEVKGRYEGKTMVAQLMEDRTVKIQPKNPAEPGQLWLPIFILGSAVGIAFVNVKKFGTMLALSGKASNADVQVVAFDPAGIPDSIIWKGCDRTTSSEFRAIQHARNDDYNLNVRGSVKPGKSIATWTWSGGDDNETWRFNLAK
jgi:hypothetical protein